MTEIASLGLSIRSDGVVVATDRLRDFAGAGKHAEDVSGSLVRMATRAGAALGAAFSIRVLQNYADGWSDMQSRIGASIKSMEAAPAFMQRITDIANASYSPLLQTTEIFGRNVTVLNALGRSATDAADFTEALNHALVTTATKGQDADVVLNALSRSIAIGGMRAMEFETIMSRSPRVLEAIAEEMGTNVTGLRALAQEGKVTSSVIVDSLINSLEQLREEAGNMPATLTDAGMIWNNVFNEVVGRVDQAWQATGRLAASSIELAIAFRGTADNLIRIGNIVGTVVGPAFDMLGANIGIITSVAGVAVAAMAGFYAPAMIGGLWTTSAALVTGIAGGINTITAAMLRNPLGLLISGLAAAVTAAYLFRDQIKQAIGIDVVAVAKAGGNMIIQAFDLAFRNIGTIWGALPLVLGDITISTANAVISGIQSMINGAIGLINDFTRGARDALGAIGLQVGDIGEVSIGTFNNPYANSLGGLGKKLGQNLKDTSGIDYLGGLASMLGDVWSNADGASGAIGALAGQLGEGEGGEPGAAGGLAGAAGAANDNLKAANDNIWGMTEALTALGPAAVDPLTLVGSQLTDLNNLLAQGKISWEQYGEAAYRANAGAMSSVLGLASGMTGALSQMFQDNKAFAVANAVVSTAEAVMKALATYGPTPWGFAAAGVAAATGAAQIATILSAQKGSSSASRPSGSAAPAASQAPAAQRSVQLNVTLGGSGRYSRDDIRDLLEQLTDGLNDGVDQGNFKLAVNS